MKFFFEIKLYFNRCLILGKCLKIIKKWFVPRGIKIGTKIFVLKEIGDIRKTYL